MSRIQAFLAELKRRHIYRVAIAYLAVVLAIIYAADVIVPALGLPGWVVTLVLVLGILGFPVALVLAWAFQLEADPDAASEPSSGVGNARTAGAATKADAVAPSDRRRAGSLVVLPFANVSPDPENEYFADGLTEEIIADLSKIRSLRVISRTSAMHLKGAEKDLRTIGRELAVRWVLEGSVRKAGDSLRITAQLIDAEEDTHLWSEKYGGTLADVFDIQEEVSRAIVEALRLELSPEEERALVDRPIPNVHAYECYLRARGEYGRFSEEGLRRALQHLENGLSIVGENALLYAALGQAYFNYGSAVVGVHEEYLDKAEECARKVFELEPDSPRGHGLLGIIRFDRFDTEEGLRHLRRAVTLDPEDLDALTWAAFCYSMCGKISRAEPWVEKLLRADPLNPFTAWTAGWHHLMAGRFDRAAEAIRRAHDMDPGAPTFRTGYAQALAYLERTDEAVALLDVDPESLPAGEVWAVVGRILAHALREEKEAALALFTEELLSDARTDMLYSWLLADCYALLREPEAALDWLENAVRGGFLNYPFLSEMDPLLGPVRGAPGFTDLMGRLKERWATLDA